jgi:hypothetical protein
MKKNQRGEMQRVKGGKRCREQREGGLNVTLGLGLENILFILAFFLSASLVEPDRFNRFQALKTESNRNFFVIF